MSNDDNFIQIEYFESDEQAFYLYTSRITWKIHESKNHLATLPEARTVTLSMIGHVQYLALSHAGVGMQSVGTRRAAAR